MRCGACRFTGRGRRTTSDSRGRSQYLAARGDCRAGSNGGKTGAERAPGGLGSLCRSCGRMARTGRIDLAWTSVSDLAANARVLWREPLVAMVAPEHLLAQTSGPISVRDLGAHPFVHRSSCELDAVGRAQLKAAGVTLRVTVRAEREERAFRLIRNGKGMTLAPRSLVPDDRVACAGVGVERGENDRGLNGARSWIQCCMALPSMRWRTWCH